MAEIVLQRILVGRENETLLAVLPREEPIPGEVVRQWLVPLWKGEQEEAHEIPPAGLSEITRAVIIFHCLICRRQILQNCGAQHQSVGIGLYSICVFAGAQPAVAFLCLLQLGCGGFQLGVQRIDAFELSQQCSFVIILVETV